MSRLSGRWRGWVRFLLIQAGATFVLCEVGTRLLTTTNSENGMAMMGGYVLVPYRPKPEAVRAWMASPPGSYLIQDRELGWTVAPRGSSADGTYRANSSGARSPQGREHGPTPAPGRLRIVTVGDSFTHGDGVGIEETWQRELERRRDDLEVINLGVPGYGTDQSYLRWQRDGRPLKPHVALLGIWPENICRNLNVVRFYLQPMGGFGFMSKPRFGLAGGDLTLVNQPVLAGEPMLDVLADPAHAPILANEYWAMPQDVEPRWWQASRVARACATVLRLHQRRQIRGALYSGERTEGIDVTVAIAEAFARDCGRQGIAPAVVLIPMLDLLAPYPQENALPLVRALRARGLEVIDLGPPMAEAVREHGDACCYLPDRHLSADGHRQLAGWMLDRLAPRLDDLRRRATGAGGSGMPVAADSRRADGR